MSLQNTRGFFITGTDTEVGKTLVAGLTMHKLKKTFDKVYGYKPVVAGISMVNGKAQNEDVVVLQRMGSTLLASENICPYQLKKPIAPHIAAAEEKVFLNPDVMLDKYHRLKKIADFLVVEGVGGFIVPINDDFDTAKFASKISLPVILVVSIKLGCLNHAVLTAEAIRNRGLCLAGWIANCIDQSPDSFAPSNIKTLKCILDSPCLGVVPFSKDIKTPYDENEIFRLAKYIDLPPISTSLE